MHTFYFSIECIPAANAMSRVERIQQVAEDNGLTIRKVSYPSSIAVWVETDNSDAAMAFKLSVENALHELHL